MAVDVGHSFTPKRRPRAPREWALRGDVGEQKDAMTGLLPLGLYMLANIREQTLGAEDRLHEAELLVPAGPVPMRKYEKPQWGFKQDAHHLLFKINELHANREENLGRVEAETPTWKPRMEFLPVYSSCLDCFQNFREELSFPLSLVASR